MICGACISFLGTIVGATGKSINQMIASGVLFGLGSGFQEMGYACWYVSTHDRSFKCEENLILILLTL